MVQKYQKAPKYVHGAWDTNSFIILMDNLMIAKIAKEKVM
jgi:hypothetical protein